MKSNKMTQKSCRIERWLQDIMRLANEMNTRVESRVDWCGKLQRDIEIRHSVAKRSLLYAQIVWIVMKTFDVSVKAVPVLDLKIS